MVTVAIRALELEYLVNILDWGRSRSRYIFTDSDSTYNSFRLRLHSPGIDDDIWALQEVRGGWRKLHNEKLHYLYASPNTVNPGYKTSV
jgi:endonuclease/exonuclease/phosphatase family metal-dependent hydrolase